MQAKKNECINEIDELIEEIKTLCNKNIQSIRNLKKYNIPNIDMKIAEIQQKSSRFFSISPSELKKLPWPKLEKVKNKCCNHIDKLLNQDLYLQQLSSKCSFLQENSYVLKEENDEESPGLNKSDTLTTLLRQSNANLSQMTIPESESDYSQSSERVSERKQKPNTREESPKVSKREYDSLLNEHMKALETIKELKRRIVQKNEEENISRFGNSNIRRNNEQKENTNLRKTYGKPNIPEQRRIRNYSQHYNSTSNTSLQIDGTNNNNPHLCQKNAFPTKNNNFQQNNYANQSSTQNNPHEAYNKKQLWSYIFQLQNTLIEEVRHNEEQKKVWTFEMSQNDKIIKQLMKEKQEKDSYKGYSAMAHYMDVMDSEEVLEVIKSARDYKDVKVVQLKMDEMKKDFSEKINRLLKEKQELNDEINNLKQELDSTKNESLYILQSQENDKEKKDKMWNLEKEKLEIERNLLEIERNKLKTEKEELMRLRELAKLSENRGYFKK